MQKTLMVLWKVAMEAGFFLTFQFCPPLQWPQLLHLLLLLYLLLLPPVLLLLLLHP